MSFLFFLYCWCAALCVCPTNYEKFILIQFNLTFIYLIISLSDLSLASNKSVSIKRHRTPDHSVSKRPSIKVGVPLDRVIPFSCACWCIALVCMFAEFTEQHASQLYRTDKRSIQPVGVVTIGSENDRSSK